MTVAKGPPIRTGGIQSPERKNMRNVRDPLMADATVCDGARAATTSPREYIAAIERRIESTKYGMLTWSCAPKISSLPKMMMKMEAKVSRRLSVS